MATDTLTHDVPGTRARYQLNKTANDTKFMTIENGPQGPQGPQGATRALYITVSFLYVFIILNYIYLQTTNK